MGSDALLYHVQWPGEPVWVFAESMAEALRLAKDSLGEAEDPESITEICDAESIVGLKPRAPIADEK